MAKTFLRPDEAQEGMLKHFVSPGARWHSYGTAAMPPVNLTRRDGASRQPTVGAAALICVQLSSFPGSSHSSPKVWAIWHD